MTVAENAVTEKPALANPSSSIVAGSLMGAVAVLGGLLVVFGILPQAWTQAEILASNPFLSSTLLFCVGAAALLGLFYAGSTFLKSATTPGLRAGIFVSALVIFIAASLGIRIGNGVQGNASEGSFGMVMFVVVLAAAIAGLVFMLIRPTFQAFLVWFEGQGFFSSTPYKSSQGVRVRRATLIGILTVGLFGIIALGYAKAFGSVANDDTEWRWTLPFTPSDEYSSYFLPLMSNCPMLLPIVLGAALIWFAYRIVNIPIFADFLIATEAEMNKVSWVTRKRLVQDTFVVLTTVLLLTSFLFFVDLFWIRILTNPFFPILKVDLRQEQQKQQEKATW